MEVDKGIHQKSDIWPHSMAANVRLKNDITEDEKYHNLMSWLKCLISVLFDEPVPFSYVQEFRQSDKIKVSWLLDFKMQEFELF